MREWDYGWVWEDCRDGISSCRIIDCRAMRRELGGRGAKDAIVLCCDRALSAIGTVAYL